MEEIKTVVVDTTKPKKVKVTDNSTNTTEEVEVTIVKEPKLIKEETITLKKSDLDAMLKRIERVEAVADKSRLKFIDDKNRELGNKVIGLSSFNDKIVLSWSKMIVNKCEKDVGAGGYIEELRTELTYIDGSKEVVDWTLWQRNRKRFPVEVLAESRNKKGLAVFEVEIDGKTYEVEETFANS